MCQLLGMSGNVPTDICFSFSGFQARGGLTDEHQDGWGIAFFEGKGVRQFLDSQASAHSPIAELVRKYPIKSKIVISHIRKATQGDVRLENTHPFMREMWGEYWIFAHNGHLDHFDPELDGSYKPVGTTDSERAFCFLLQNLKLKFGTEKPSERELFKAIREYSILLAKFGECNFLLSNGEALYTHCSTHLFYLIRKSPFASAHLMDQDLEIDFSEVTTPDDQVAVIATAPLTHSENWVEIPRGTILVFKDGSVERQEPTFPGKTREELEGQV